MSGKYYIIDVPRKTGTDAEFLAEMREFRMELSDMDQSNDQVKDAIADADYAIANIISEAYSGDSDAEPSETWEDFLAGI